MGIYFLIDLHGAEQEDWQCLYCERSFKERRTLNEHYVAAHEEAFSEEELNMARSRRSELIQGLKRSPPNPDT